MAVPSHAVSSTGELVWEKIWLVVEAGGRNKREWAAILNHRNALSGTPTCFGHSI
jgi:hypothetical protein